MNVCISGAIGRVPTNYVALQWVEVDQPCPKTSVSTEFLRILYIFLFVFQASNLALNVK